MWDFFVSRFDQIWVASLQHVSLVIQCLLLAAVLAVGIAALVYRNQLAGSAALDQAGGEAAAQAKDSLGGAVDVSGQLGLPALATDAGAAFTQSLQTAGLVGGVLMLVVAAAVFIMTPKGTDISSSSHG